VIVDTHTHVIAHDEARYPLRPSGVGSPWYRESPCDANELAELMTAAGVDAAVLVQAFGAYTYDNSYTVDSAAASPDRFVSIAVVDAQDPASPATVSALLHETGFTGVRLFSIGALEHPQPTWLDHPITFELWEVCANLGLRVLVACLPEHLSRLQRVLAQFPEQPVVLDHAGFVALDGGPPYPEAAALFDLVEHTNLHLKVTSHLLEASEAQGDACEIVDRLVGEFGAHRLVWGSDYPQTHDRSYADLVALAQHACRNLSELDRALVLGGTALELWPELAR
jgi:predicted TIM-barrel fold metal-dependent hydrolase